MSAEIGSWVRWTELSPTRLGYTASDIGQVVGARPGRSGDREIDVQFADGHVLLGAFEQWFERAQFQIEDETSSQPALRMADTEPL